MKTLQLVEIGRPLEARDAPVPEVGSREVLVRVRAAGICHSDAHYQAGAPRVPFLPLTLGHEVAGIVERIGAEVDQFRPGDRVAVHYLATCGTCRFCREGHEQFCADGQMMGKHRHGGYAEFVVMPAASLVMVPEGVALAHAAVMMCSTATAYHALRRGRLEPGQQVAIIGAGGLGISAVQLARIMGASQIVAVDIRPEKLRTAAACGATPVDASRTDPVEAIRALTDGGADVALDLVGHTGTMIQAIRSVAPRGRAVMVGLPDRELAIDVYRDVLGREVEVIGSSDHLRSELPAVLEFARQGLLDFSRVVTRIVPLEAALVNEVFDRLHAYQADVRTVIVPA